MLDAGELQVLLAPAVTLERGRAAVGLPAVDFDRESLGLPVGVDLVAGRRRRSIERLRQRSPSRLQPGERSARRRTRSVEPRLRGDRRSGAAAGACLTPCARGRSRGLRDHRPVRRRARRRPGSARIAVAGEENLDECRAPCSGERPRARAAVPARRAAEEWRTIDPASSDRRAGDLLRRAPTGP